MAVTPDPSSAYAQLARLLHRDIVAATLADGLAELRSQVPVAQAMDRWWRAQQTPDGRRPSATDHACLRLAYAHGAGRSPQVRHAAFWTSPLATVGPRPWAVLGRYWAPHATPGGYAPPTT